MHNLESNKLYSSLWLPIPTHDFSPVRILPHLLKPPPLLPRLHLLWSKLSLTIQFKPFLTSPKNYLKNKMNNFKSALTNKVKNWLISNQRHFVSMTKPRWSNKQLFFFLQNSNNRRIIFLHLIHPLKNALIIWVSATELEIKL